MPEILYEQLFLSDEKGEWIEENLWERVWFWWNFLFSQKRIKPALTEIRFASSWISLTLTPYIPVSLILVLFLFRPSMFLLWILILLFSCLNSSFLCFSQTVFERNCQSDDCAADLKLQGKLLLSGWVGQLLFFSCTLVCHSFYVEWHWKIKIQTQLF